MLALRMRAIRRRADVSTFASHFCVSIDEGQCVAIGWKVMILCAASSFFFILSSCKIITLDAIRNIHTLVASLHEAAGMKGMDSVGAICSEWGTVDRKQNCNFALKGNMPQVSGCQDAVLFTLIACSAAGMIQAAAGFTDYGFTLAGGG